MFERYTERARRVVFFARYEASLLGSNAIGTEHLLLGLIRENHGLPARLFRERSLSSSTVRAAVATEGERVSTAVDMPLTEEAKCALANAQEEAELMLHNYIGTEHLLLGLLRVREGIAAQVLAENGIRLGRVREDLVHFLRASEDSQSRMNEPFARQPKIGDIVHYHRKGEQGLIASAAIVTSILNIEEERVSLIAFDARQGPTVVPDALPGRLAAQPEEDRWTWPIE